MATKKKAAKPKSDSKKPAPQPVELSPEKRVKNEIANATVKKFKNGYVILADPKKKIEPENLLFSGIAKTEADAWKKAAHQLT